jgi:putative tryptophan/tyrosine transport system substrate-binding protein
MKRRAFITLLGGAAAAWPFPARAQRPSGRVAHIAYLGALSPSTLDPRQIKQFNAGLKENGFVDGRNIAVEYLWAEGSQDRLQQLAAELARRDLDAIVTAGPQAVRALMATQTKTPIVFAIIGDALADRVVDSLARPGGNVTGLSMSNKDLESKRIEVLKDAVPAMTHVMLLHDPSMGVAGLAEAQAAARTLGVEPFVVETSDPSQFDTAFARAVDRSVNGIATMASPFLNFHRKALIALAARHRLPSIWEGAAYVRDGGLLSYGPSFPDMYRRSAAYVAKIINGAKPADLPVELPIKFELAINVETAKALGLEVPPTLLARADEVIE